MAPTNRKEFSHDLREVVIKRYLNGDSEWDVARDLLISRNTVHYTIAKYKSTKCVIQRKIKTNRRKSALAVQTELQTELNIAVSESTIRRRAHEIGLYGRVARKKTIGNYS